MIVFFALLGSLALAGAVATVLELTYRGPQRVRNRTYMR
jgi:hypothetical protein